MVEITLTLTAFILLAMGIVCLRFLRDRPENPSESFQKSYGFLVGRLLASWAFDGFHGRQISGIEMYPSALAVMSTDLIS